MGYCYGYKTKKLCCDCCGKEGARKRKCPHGWCPSPALCSDCNKAARTDGRWSQWHCKCEESHRACVERDAKEAAILDAGKFVRCSALNAGENRVHVLFVNKDKKVIGKYMTPEAYDSIPLLEIATVEDYRKEFTLVEAPSELFPYETHSTNGMRLCVSYEHHGQHGGASYTGRIKRSGPVGLDESDVKALIQELESLGYNLEIRTKATFTAKNLGKCS